MKTSFKTTAAALAAAVLWLLAGPATAQLVYDRVYGTARNNETLGSMTPLRTGGYLLVGTQELRAGVRMEVRRITAIGDTLWTKHFRMPSLPVIYVFNSLEDLGGRVLVTGSGATASGTTGTDAFMAMLNPQGDTLWTKRLSAMGQDIYNKPVLMPGGDFLFTIYTGGQGRLVRITPAGQTVFQINVSYSTTVVGAVGDIYPDGLGSYRVVTGSPGAPIKFVLYDANGVRGNEIVANSAVSTFEDLQTDGANYMAINNTFTVPQLMRLDANFTPIWQSSPLATGRNVDYKYIRRTLDGNFLVGGEAYIPVAGTVQTDFAFLKITPQGRVLKDTVLSAFGVERLRGMSVAPVSGNYVFAGYTDSGPIGGADVLWGQLRRYTITPTRAAQAAAQAAGLAATAYPNPTGADGLLTLRTAQPLRGELRLTNLLGQQLRAWPAASGPEQPVSLAGLPGGVYLLHFADGQGRRYALRVVRP